ncbi:hypothetical protein PNOK_0251100 [Pyrrhoderma noxium]|uniref:Uncharacterized protein n=1 Tax=Pyrrhoderma noxium TaxID=2282107 RepID=A0A286USM3_9AGAM|nr:hypothetical protein PNOK_0251100 [Pyrrhoderma noxium]
MKSRNPAVNLRLIDWLVRPIVGFALLLLALCKVVGYWRALGLKKSDLFTTIMRDQAIYYIMLLICSGIKVANLGGVSDISSRSFYILYALGNPSLLSLYGSRMFLNLKEIGESKTKEGFCGAADARSSLHVPKFAEHDLASSKALFSIVIVEYVLIIRILALWQNNRILSFFLYLLLICEAAIRVVVTVMVMLSSELQFNFTVQGQAFVIALQTVAADTVYSRSALVGPDSLQSGRTLEIIGANEE